MNFSRLVDFTREHKKFHTLYPKYPDLNAEPTTTTTTSPPSKKTQTISPRVFGIDCEMIQTTDAALQDERQTLARASLVEYLFSSSSFELIFDFYVKPPLNRKVKDRMEHLSGITEENLAQATLFVEDVVKELERVVNSQHDVVVGHSLHSDLHVLPHWQPLRIVDTSFFFSLPTLPKLTLSLDDALVECTGESVHSFNVSHDSVHDAQAALTVFLFLLSSDVLPVVLEDIPLRLKKQLCFHRIDRKLHENDYQVMITQLVNTSTARFRPIKWVDEHGSVVVEFSTEKDAVRCFQLLPVNVSQCHKDGFPYNAEGHLKKLIKSKMFSCEVTSHVKMDLTRRMEFVCKTKDAGKIIGTKGLQINHIQHVCGVKIDNTVKNPKESVFSILANDTSKCEEAFMRLKLAQEGKYTM